jgi:hypothetical protein
LAGMKGPRATHADNKVISARRNAKRAATPAARFCIVRSLRSS